MWPKTTLLLLVGPIDAKMLGTPVKCLKACNEKLCSSQGSLKIILMNVVIFIENLSLEKICTVDEIALCWD